MSLNSKLPQLVVDAKNSGWYDWITEPDGRLHPNTERALLDGCYFDPAAAERVMQFYVTLLMIPRSPRNDPFNSWERQWIDRYIPNFNYGKPTPRKPFVLLEFWYRRIIGQLYGWKRSDHRRRYDKGFMTTGKKQAKSTTLSGLPLYAMLADEEEEAEAYASAVDRDQASIIFSKTNKMQKDSPHLSKLLRPIESQKRIVYEPTGSIFEAISHDADSAEGKNPSLLLVDELHAWRTRNFFESLMYGDVVRDQPLFLMITTAGDDDLSIGYEEYEYAKELLDPANDFYSMSHFAYIAEAGRDLETGAIAPVPEGETENFDWDDPKSWQQACPALAEGVGSLEKLQAKCDEAKKSPAKKRSFIRYICNRWVAGSDDVWLNRSFWRECISSDGGQFEPTSGETVWLGFDFATVEDLVGLAIAWWIDHETIGLKVRHFMPAEGVKKKQERWRVPLDLWIEDGWIETTPGRTVNTAFLREQISGVTLDVDGTASKQRLPHSINERYNVTEMAFDRAHAHDLVILQLGDTDGMPVVQHGQGTMGMTAPSKAFAKKINDGKIVHDGNPVMDWQVGHCVVDVDPAGSIKPNKKKSRHKIDGIVASIMAVGRAIATPPPKPSVYKRRGVLTF